MPLFQQSVLNKFLAQQDKSEVLKAYKKLLQVFSQYSHPSKH